MTQINEISVHGSTNKLALSNRLDDFGWAVLLIVIGIIWLLPENVMPRGSWLIATGVILLGLNAIRYFNGITMVGFSLVAGVLALLAGLGSFFGLTLPLFAIALILIGVVMLFKPLLDRSSVSDPGRGWCCCGQADSEHHHDAVSGRAADH